MAAHGDGRAVCTSQRLGAGALAHLDCYAERVGPAAASTRAATNSAKFAAGRTPSRASPAPRP